MRVRSAVGENQSVYDRQPSPAGDGVTTKTVLAGDGDHANEMDTGTSEIHPDLEMHGGLTPPDSPTRGPASSVTAAGGPQEACDALNCLDEVDVRMLCQMARGVDVSEIYSPVRVAKVAEAM